jgi:uncharacterized membrane protein (UPF0127 family)
MAGPPQSPTQTPGSFASISPMLTRRPFDMRLRHDHHHSGIGFIAVYAAVCLTWLMLSAWPCRGEDGLEKLTIQTQTGVFPFFVEVMRSESEREKGLMFRRYLPPDRGMLFDFKVEAPVMMWMKNTFLPLDMIFISRSGVVKNIVQNAEPMSETIIPSGGNVFAVLEVNAGTAAKIGVHAGDRVEHPIFSK